MDRKYSLFAAIIFLGTIATGFCDDPEFHIISRDEWGAEPPRHSPVPLILYPSPFVVVTHTRLQPCSTRAECEPILRGMQHMYQYELGWNDIADNFLIGGDGNVYEGRGWEYEGVHSTKYKYKSINVAFMGEYRRTDPTQQQLTALQNFLDYSERNGRICRRYQLIGLIQIEPQWSPGERLYRAIQSFPRWVREPSF